MIEARTHRQQTNDPVGPMLGLPSSLLELDQMGTRATATSFLLSA